MKTYIVVLNLAVEAKDKTEAKRLFKDRIIDEDFDDTNIVVRELRLN